MGGGKNSVTSGAAGPAMCRPVPVRRGPWMSRSPHALPAPEYRLVPRVGSIPTPRVVMPAGFPWRQGMLCEDGIASVKFSLPERLPSNHHAHIADDSLGSFGNRLRIQYLRQNLRLGR